jgi:hypothetical protein
MRTWCFENEVVETQGIVVIPSDVKEMLFITDCLSFVGSKCVRDVGCYITRNFDVTCSLNKECIYNSSGEQLF